MSSNSAVTHPAPGSRAGLAAAHLSEALWLGLLIVIPLTMNVAGVRTFEAAKLAAAAPFAALLICVLLAAWIDGAARLPSGAGRQALLWGFCGLIACVLISTAASDTPLISLFGDYFRREGLVSWLVYASLFAGILLMMRERVQVERLIDATLIASVIPCIYALQQVYGYDFFMTAGLAQTRRPGGNLGNPIFLSAYLLLLVPVAIARLLRTPKPWSARLPWMLLLGVLLFTAFVTQSRGPLFGLAAALFLVTLLTGALYGSRKLVLGALAGAVLAGAFLLALNFVPAVQAVFKDYPLISRFSFTTSASLTANSRIGIWQMGVDAFLHAPWWRQLIGAGPDSAHFAYFTYEPAWVLRIEGYSETIDRLHSELTETTTTLGILGALANATLFSGAVWLAVTRLSGRSGAPLAWLFALLCTFAAGLTATVLVSIGQARGLLPIGLGLGLSLGWTVALATAAWHGMSKARNHDRNDSLLLIALVCALIGFWVESQVGVPTIATRSLVATFAALILLLGVNAFAPAPAAMTVSEPPPAPAPAAAAQPAGRRGKSAKVKPSAAAKTPVHMHHQTMTGWFTGMVLVICTSAFFPPLSGQVIHAPSPQRLNLIIVPLLGLILSGAVFAWYEAARLKKPLIDALTHFLLWMALPWFGFMVLYAQLGGRITGAGDALVGERINGLLALQFAAALLLTLMFGLLSYWRDTRRQALARARLPALAALAGGVALAAGAYWAAMLDVRADTYAKLGGWALGQGRADASTRFHLQATELVPHERRFTGTYAARLIEQAAGNLRLIPSQPALAATVLEQLKQAEIAILRAVAVAPHDPWTTFAHANVNQFFALAMLEKHQPPGETARRVEKTRSLFELAHKQFPAHPWIVRNWAQFEFDRGDRPAAYARFDQMEAIDPLNTSAFAERLRFTRSTGEHTIAIAALRKGIAAQTPGSAAVRELRNMLAQYLIDTGQPAQALGVYLEMIEADANDFLAVYQAAEVYDRSGQRTLALGNLQAALARLAALPRTPKLDADRIKLEQLAARLGAR